MLVNSSYYSLRVAESIARGQGVSGFIVVMNGNGSQCFLSILKSCCGYEVAFSFFRVREGVFLSSFLSLSLFLSTFVSSHACWKGKEGGGRFFGGKNVGGWFCELRDKEGSGKKIVDYIT